MAKEELHNTKIISIYATPPPYDVIPSQLRSRVKWDKPNEGEGEIWENDFLILLANEILKLTPEFKYEAWQPSLGIDKVYSYTFENNLTYRLFPAMAKSKLYGLKIIKEIYSDSLLAAVEKEINTNNVVIHMHGNLCSLIYERIIEKFKKAKIIFSFHGVINFPSVRFFTLAKNVPSKISLLLEHFWIKQHIEKIKYITYCSDKNLIHLTKIYKGKTGKITMGCNFSFFAKLDKNICRQNLKLPYDRFIMLTVANFSDTKQIDRFIKVLIRIMHKHEFLYIIIGQGSEQYEKYLKKLAGPLSRKDKIRFTGYLRGEPLLKYLNSADLFISTSISEGGPVTVMEAFACELPVFSTNTGNTAELMEKENAGVLVGTKDYGAWKKELEKILETKQLPKIVDRNVAKEYYDWSNIAKKFTRVYESFI